MHVTPTGLAERKLWQALSVESGYILTCFFPVVYALVYNFAA